MLRVAVKRIQSRICFVYILFIFVKRCIVCLFVKLQVSVVNVGTPFDKVGVNVIGCIEPQVDTGSRFFIFLFDCISHTLS